MPYTYKNIESSIFKGVSSASSQSNIVLAPRPQVMHV